MAFSSDSELIIATDFRFHLYKTLRQPISEKTDHRIGMDTRSAIMNDKSTLKFWLMLFGGMVVIMDTALYFTLHQLNKSRNIFYASRTITEEQLQKFLDERFHPVLGWDIARSERNALGARGPREYPEKQRYKIKVFGDSFTYGAEVAPEETFEAVLERQRGWECLNYGVGAYGTDQAFLKYQLTQVPTEYTVLGVLCENIGRVVSFYPAWYMRFWAPPKPRFFLSGDSLRLMPSPITSPEAARALLDPGYIESLRAYDYWPSFYEDRLHAPARLVWPASYTILGHLDFFLSRARLEIERRAAPTWDIEKQTYKYYHLYEGQSEALRILTGIIDKFIALAQSRGEVPIILLFADQYSLDLMRKYDRNPYRPLSDHVRKTGVAYLDLGAVFIRENYGRYFNYYNSHYSPEGNKRVAEELGKLIAGLEAAGR